MRGKVYLNLFRLLTIWHNDLLSEWKPVPIILYEALTCFFQQLPYHGKYVDALKVKVLERLR
jgi:hypothetical protein